MARYKLSSQVSLTAVTCSGTVLFSRVVANQVSSAFVSLTSVFGMGTGGSLQPFAPDILFSEGFIHPQNRTKQSKNKHSNQVRTSPRPISTVWLNASRRLHPRPINLIVLEGSYSFQMGYLILRAVSRLDAFSVYPFRT